jgi:flagellar biosynthesis anti-sigma factor FlgM
MKVQSHAIQAYARTALNPVAPAPVQQPAAEPSQPVNNDEAVQVTLSAEARQLAAQQSGIDHEKVNALREKVDNGELKVNPQILAMRILDSFR